MHQSSKLHLGVPESLLRKLLRRYPHGKVFNFDDDGSLSASEGASDTSVEETRKSEESTHQEKLKPRKMSREEEGKAILKVCPGARCVAFFPLWDSHKERWFVGNLAWTTDPTRVLDPEEDLTYLAAFGNSIMAEVSRLNAVMSSQMKNSFISGISHELRSPLHGVLASVEFLQDSNMSEQQQEMVSIIGFCGRTLLDTLNHVLDFTKLRNAPKHTPESGRRNQQNDFSFSRDRMLQESISVDLRVLTEEVIEGVYVGNCFAKSSSMNKDALMVSGHSPQTKSQTSAPMIILDLESRSNWALDIDPGAWRRLIMNIFGNALKYTETGFIRVSLKSSDVQSAKGISSSMVTLTVTDTGKGISQEFLNHQMYTPFAQEDSLAAGSGLGLSIVRHIVNELHGSIEIESAQGSGTEVKIILSLASSYVSLSSSASLDPLPLVQKNLRGLDACLVGFHKFPDIGDELTGIMSIDAKRMFSLKSSITSLLNGWFEMRVLAVPTLEESTAKVCCIMESTFDEMLSAGWLGADIGTHQVEKSLLLVLRTAPYQSYPPLSHSKYDIIYVQQP
jgi:signal transduction histidine kinase